MNTQVSLDSPQDKSFNPCLWHREIKCLGSMEDFVRVQYGNVLTHLAHLTLPAKY